jgi:hypothetical protein
MKISNWADICKNKPLEKLEKLHICGSHLMRGGSHGFENSLKSVLTTFNVLKILKIENATCLLQSHITIESLALLEQLETLGMYVYMCVYIRIFVYEYICIYIHSYTHTYVSLCIYIHICIYMHKLVHSFSITIKSLTLLEQLETLGI